MADRWALRFCLAAIVSLLAVGSVRSQRVAVIAPNGSELDKAVAAAMTRTLSAKLRVQDADMSWAAYTAIKPESPFNMTADEAKRVGSVLGCDFFVLLNTDTRRRATLSGPDHVEAYAVIYLVNAQTGLLANWAIASASFVDAADSRKQVLVTVAAFARDVIQAISDREGSASDTSTVTEIPSPDSPDAKGFKPPIPYSRIKPEYTRTAYLYDVTATVEATVDLDEKGQIKQIRMTRWAGYELDESVTKAIRSMNWRPAERDGKPLPVRFLLRYNFKKIEKDDTDNE
jgi:hypothetical protein